jgi:hypothetical protein
VDVWVVGGRVAAATAGVSVGSGGDSVGDSVTGSADGVGTDTVAGEQPANHKTVNRPIVKIECVFIFLLSTLGSHSTKICGPKLLRFYYVINLINHSSGGVGVVYFDAPDFLRYTYFVTKFSIKFRRL